MYDSAKYLIHADIRTSGVVERSDVVGAVFGQTEGLLGDELDLRDLQESGKVGRIDVEIDSERGSSFGEITIATGLDRVQTAILAAALESIDRVGPSKADVEIGEIEDVRSAKRRQVVERATELLAEFDETTMSSEDLVEAVRRSVRVEDITDFHGLPAGPRVADSDAIIVVEGRSDVLTLLRYGVKNAIAVEGTDVPDAVAELTDGRTVTAFLDGDRGGDLILKELSQVGTIDYVALAPTDRSVEDLSRSEVMSALRDKVPFETVSTADAEASDSQGLAATDGSTQPSPSDGESAAEATTAPESPAEPERADAPGADASGADTEDALVRGGTTSESSSDGGTQGAETAQGPESAVETADAGTSTEAVETLASHVEAVIEESTEQVRLLDAEYDVLAEGPVGEAFDMVESADVVPDSIVLDGELSQRILDVAAQRGVDFAVCREEGEYVKQPVGVRVLTADEI